VIGSLVTLFLALMLFCALLALQVKDLLSAVVIFGAFSFFSAILFTLLGALDVAFTEAAVGAAITTVFFVSTIYRTDRKAE
jgi:uncharacterized MnhB-related membrane protein